MLINPFIAVPNVIESMACAQRSGVEGRNPKSSGDEDEFE